MHDIRLNFNGESDTLIDLTAKVEGKALYEQKCLVNLATEQESDPLYPTRGTTILKSCIGGTIISSNAADHVGNFAALNTLMFVRGEDYAAVQSSGDIITQCGLTPVELDETTLGYTVIFGFADGTKTETTFTI